MGIRIINKIGHPNGAKSISTLKLGGNNAQLIIVQIIPTMKALKIFKKIVDVQIISLKSLEKLNSDVIS